MEININVKSGQQKWSVSIDSSRTILNLKDEISNVSSIPSLNQRLIYSGKILKDDQIIESYKILDGHTIHLVKSGDVKNERNTSNQSSTTSGVHSTNTSTIPTNITSGQSSGFNPLADLTGARYAGFANLPSMDMFGPDGGLTNALGSDEMLRMMENPIFQSQMNEMLSNPQMVDFLIQQNPQLQALGPQARMMLQSPFFRSMMTNPEMIRQSMNMARALGHNGPGGESETSDFPAPGSTNTDDTPTGNIPENSADSFTNSNTRSNPFASLFNAQANPFASLFPYGQQSQIDPSVLQSMFNGLGSSTEPVQQDTRPPEERYEQQLRQLNDMGFFDFNRNVAALRRSGGSVQGAIDSLLSHDV